MIVDFRNLCIEDKMKLQKLFSITNNDNQTLSADSVSLHYAPTGLWKERMSNAGKGFLE